MKELLEFLIKNRTLVKFKEIKSATGLSESEVISLIERAKVMFNFEPKFTYAEEGAVFMYGNLRLVKEYLRMD